MTCSLYWQISDVTLSKLAQHCHQLERLVSAVEPLQFLPIWNHPLCIMWTLDVVPTFVNELWNQDITWYYMYCAYPFRGRSRKKVECALLIVKKISNIYLSRHSYNYVQYKPSLKYLSGYSVSALRHPLRHFLKPTTVWLINQQLININF